MEERIFSWSLDGFGSTLFRIIEEGREHFVNRYSSMDVDETDQEVLKNGEVEYSSFEEFWCAFTNEPSWFRYRPVYVYEGYKPFLQDFFSNIPQGSLTMGEKFRIILWLHMIEN